MIIVHFILCRVLIKLRTDAEIQNWLCDFKNSKADTNGLGSATLMKC